MQKTCVIALVNSNERIQYARVWCQGGLEDTGQRLLRYQTKKAISQIVQDDLISLGSTFEETLFHCGGHNVSPRLSNSNYDGTPAQFITDMLTKESWDFVYVFYDGQWYCWDRNGNIYFGWDNWLRTFAAVPSVFSVRKP